MDLTHPFDDTPAQNWAGGVAGLTTPPPAKEGTFTAKQTAEAIDSVKKAITAAFLDPDLLLGHHTDHLLALLAPDSRAGVRPLVPARTSPGARLGDLVADGYHLLPVAPRVTGSLTVKPGARGELGVHASYVIAYAFDPGDTEVESPGDIVPFLRLETDYVSARRRCSARAAWACGRKTPRWPSSRSRTEPRRPAGWPPPTANGWTADPRPRRSPASPSHQADADRGYLRLVISTPGFHSLNCVYDQCSDRRDPPRR